MCPVIEEERERRKYDDYVLTDMTEKYTDTLERLATVMDMEIETFNVGVANEYTDALFSHWFN